MTRLQSHRHEEVARTLGSGSGKGWCLDLDEIEVEEHVPSDLVDLRSHAQGITRRLTAKVEVAVLQSNLVADRHALIDGERQWRGD